MESDNADMLLKRVLVVAALCAGLSMHAAAHSGEVTGTVGSLFVRDSDRLTYVHVAGTATNRPACAASTTYWMIPNENSEAGKKLYAMLLAAKLAGSRVSIVGKNTCARWGDGEDINYAAAVD